MVIPGGDSRLWFQVVVPGGGSRWWFQVVIPGGDSRWRFRAGGGSNRQSDCVVLEFVDVLRDGSNSGLPPAGHGFCRG